MAKKITGYLKLQVPAGAANPSPPIGPALGQRGLNIMEFCKAFNAQTQKEEKNTPIPVIITIYADRSFTFEMKTPPMSYFLKQAAGVAKGFLERMDQDGKELFGEIETDPPGNEQRIDAFEQAAAQLDQMVQQGRLAVVNLADHAAASPCLGAAGSSAT